MKDRTNIINYRKYILTYIILFVIIALINLMFIISPIFASSYFDTICTKLFILLGGIPSLLPIPLFEIISILLVCFLIILVVRFTVLFIKARNNTKLMIIVSLKKTALNLLIVILSILTLFTLVYSANYHKLDFRACNNINVKEVSEEKITDIFDSMISEANKLSDTNLTNDDTELYVQTTFEGMSEKYPCLRDNLHYSPKRSLFSKTYFSAFTSEIIYNKNSDNYLLPVEIFTAYSSACGFTNKSEKLYIAFLACEENHLFKYSAKLLAINSILFEYPEFQQKITASANQKVINDLTLFDHLINRNSKYIKSLNDLIVYYYSSMRE